MEEKIYTKKKNGMVALLLLILLIVAGIAAIVGGALLLENEKNFGVVLLVAGILICAFGWIPFIGLKVLKPQEALVLTLFGDYKGTIREPGFCESFLYCSESCGSNEAGSKRRCVECK